MVQHASCEKKKKTNKKKHPNMHLKVPLGKIKFNWYKKFGMNKIVENDNNYAKCFHST